MTAKTELEVAEGQVRVGKDIVARQREIVSGLRRSGHSAGRASGPLATFEARLAEAGKRLVQIQSGGDVN
jgi:hypothetical protein